MIEHPGITSRRIDVLGGVMHALEAGSGSPILFLHGNPTSSELWRSVIDQLSPCCHCIAPDLIGMGQSSKPSINYTFVDHARFLNAFLDALGLNEVVFVAHDWGVALALDIMARKPERVRGIAFMEGRVRPLPDWSAFDEGGRQLFQQFRREPDGTRLVINENMLIEVILQAGTIRNLTEAELGAYRAPYLELESRWPLLKWTREIPVGHEPAVVAQRMQLGYAALRSSPKPKLALVATPGAVIDEREIEVWRNEIPNLRIIDVGKGSHFLPHDRPAEIASALRQWMQASGFAE